jgi:hypothetical protein
MGAIVLEIVKASLAAGLTLLGAWLQKRRDLRDLHSGKKHLEDFKEYK